MAASELRLGDTNLAPHLLCAAAVGRMIFEGDDAVDAVILDANPALMELFGRRDVVGKRLTELAPRLRDQDPDVLAALARVARGGPSQSPERFDMFVATANAWYSVSLFSPAPARFVALFDEALRRSDGRLSAVLASIDDLLFGLDLQCRFTDFHAPAGKSLYAARGTFLGRAVEAVLPPTLAAEVARATEQVRTSGHDEVFDYELVVEGRTEWWSAKVTARRDAAGSVVGYTVVSRDITQRKTAELALRKSEQDFRRLAELAPVGIVQVDRATRRITFANRRMCVITGYSREELVGTTVASITHPEDVALDERAFADADSDLTVTYEKRYLRKDGSICWVSLNIGVMRDPNGLATHNMAAIEDISERRAADESRRLATSALEAAANGIVITDAAGNVQWVNTAYTALTGYPRTELVGVNQRILRSGLQDRAFYTKLWETISGGQVWRGELVNKRRDGSTYDEEMTITPVRSRGDDITHFIGIKQDISARKKAEADLRTTAEQLRVAQKMEAVGRLAGGIAHDFNNMLSVILSYTELATADLGTHDPLRGDLDEIANAAKRAELLTRQLLAFSRTQVLHSEHFDLNALVQGLAKMVTRVIGEDIDFEFNAPDEAIETYGDRGRFEQVLMNLIVNARDAMPDGGRLSITTAKTTLTTERAAALECAPGPYVVLVVKDTGTGMDDATRERIFEPFFTTKGVGRGTGLGLAMVYGTVRQSGGALEVQSELGSGSEFRIFLPEDAAGPKAASVHASPRPTSEGHEQVLLVEDEASLRTVIRRVLTAAGYRVEAAANAGEALLLCEKDGGRFDLILTDVVMPGMNGRRLVERIASLCPSAKILFMSGYAEDTLKDYGPMPATFLRKPFDPATLAEAVRAILDAPAPFQQQALGI